MDVFKAAVQLIFDAMTYTHVGIFSALLLFYLAVCTVLLLIKLVKGARK